MAFIYWCLLLITFIIFGTDCQQQGFLAGSNSPFAGFLQSMASQVPSLSQKGAIASSNLAQPQAPQILLDAFKSAAPRPAAAAPAPTPLDGVMGMFGGTGARSRAAPNRASVPVTPGTKAMVSKMASQMGYKAYYEAHGCVDPTSALMGGQAQLASLVLMMGCNNYQASEICDMAQMAQAGGQATNTRAMIDMMVGKDTKHMLEECLTPSTFISGLGNMLSPRQNRTTQPGYAPPPAAADQSKRAVDCSGVSQMLMMSAATEGLLNMEILEQIGKMRNRYFKMTCQENVIFGGLPYRLCCPGHVKQPTMEEVMMMRGMVGM